MAQTQNDPPDNLIPNRADALAHVEAIHAPGDVIEGRFFRGDERPLQIWRTYEARHELIDLAIEHNVDGFDTYVGIAPRPAVGASKNKCIVLTRCVFVDFDAKHMAATEEYGQRSEIASRIDGTGLPPPTLIVFSGHGWHCYWLFDGPLTDMNRWSRLIDALIATLGSDTACSNEERIMRLAGTVNRKKHPAVGSGIVYRDPAARYAVETLEAAPGIRDAIAAATTPSTVNVDVLSAIAFGSNKRLAAKDGRDSVIDLYNASVDKPDQMRGYGFTIVGDRIRRPGKTDRGFSGLIRPNKQGNKVSCHWSENDVLNDRKFGRGVGRPGTMGIHDAFSAYVIVEHRGDFKAAVKAAARAMGMHNRRDYEILEAIDASVDADQFALLYTGNLTSVVGDVDAAIERLVAIVGRHSRSREQVMRIVARSTPALEVA